MCGTELAYRPTRCVVLSSRIVQSKLIAQEREMQEKQVPPEIKDKKPQSHVHPEIQDKKPRFQYKLYQEC
eukprot:573318-Rhodomonas_salina.1